MDLTFGQLRSWVSTHAAIRRIQRLQPVGGKGDTVFPTTYPGESNGKADEPPPVHVYEVRRIDERDVACTLVDSVQSRANRLEFALMNSILSGAVKIPYLEIDFGGAFKEVGRRGRLSSLEASHRIYDSAFRDAELDGIPFKDTAIGSALRRASPMDAKALLAVSPHALVFGAWHTQGFKGESFGKAAGARFQRCLISEIIAANTPVEDIVDPRTGAVVDRRTALRRRAVRIDTLGIVKGVPVYKSNTNWSDREEEAGENARLVDPSDILHGSIISSVSALGVTMDYAVHRTVLTLGALRRLSFDDDPEKNATVRAYLAALGVLACAEQDICGFSLRSRCDLVPEPPAAPYELIAADGTSTDLAIDVHGARVLYEAGLQAVIEAGFEMHLTPIRLVQQRKLGSIMQASRDLTGSGELTKPEAVG
jgi:CRISPR-associated protein Csb1